MHERVPGWQAWWRRGVRACSLALCVVPATTWAVAPAGEATGDSRPIALDMTPPVYPVGAAGRKSQGTVVLVITVDADGKVSHAPVETSSQDPALDDAAVRAALGWRFIPSVSSGKASTSRLRVPVDFKIPRAMKVAPGAATPGPYVPPRALALSPPPYPKQAGWQGAGGTTTLLVKVGADGNVSGMRVESSAGHYMLDAAALVAARHWRFVPATRGDVPTSGEVRVPVAFDVPAHYALDRRTGRARDVHFEQRRAASGVAPTPDAKGVYPGFLEDALPIGVSSVAEGETLLARHAFAEADAGPLGTREFTQRDEEGLSVWYVTSEERVPRALVRRRLVTDGSTAWFVSSVLCEGTEPACADWLASYRAAVPAQQPLPGAPPPVANR